MYCRLIKGVLTMFSEALKYAKEQTFTKSNLVIWSLVQVLLYLVKWPNHNPTIVSVVGSLLIVYVLCFIILFLWSLLK
jgi:hypothetical protein